MARNLRSAWEMRLFDLRFKNRATLLAGFRTAQGRESLESCTLDIGPLRMCFVAPGERAEALVRQIYLDGGLRWCSRHELGPSKADDGA